MQTSNKGWLVAALIILGIIGLLIITINDGNRILRSNEHGHNDPVPYYTKLLDRVEEI